MKNKTYSSYQQIDEDLEILRLEKEIAQKKLTLSLEKTVDSFTPNSVIVNAVSSIGQNISKIGVVEKFVFPWLIKKFIKK